VNGGPRRFPKLAIKIEKLVTIFWHIYVPALGPFTMSMVVVTLPTAGTLTWINAMLI
jgi:hypothetical protein